MTSHVAYFRVSTERQGRSGLGLDAQKSAVRRFLGDGTPVAEYIEVESGKRNSRPELVRAIEHARATGSVLIVAKLDRLARNARFLLGVVESGVDVVFCDLPQIPPGSLGKFFLTMMAAVAELEGGMISERTKAALSAAKANGVVLGSAGKILAEANRAAATEFANSVKPTIVSLQDRGITSRAGIAEELNRMAFRTPTGGKWHPTTVGRVLSRI